MARGRVQWDWRAGVVLGVLAAVLLMGAAVALERSRAVEGVESLPAPAVPADPPVALVIGDSFAEGTGADDPRTTGFPNLLAAQMGWMLSLDAEGGTGYVEDGPEEQPDRTTYVERSTRHSGADVVLVTGGINDRTLLQQGEVTPEDYRAAVAETYDNLLTTMPDARIVAVGPFWVDADPPADVLAMRDVVQAAAQERSLAFIDPIAGAWVTVENEGQVTGPDGTHPTQVGHQLIADRLAADLSALGIAPTAG